MPAKHLIPLLTTTNAAAVPKKTKPIADVSNEAQPVCLALRLQRAADALDISRITLWRLVRGGKLKVVHVAPRCPRIPMSSLEEYMASLLEEESA